METFRKEVMTLLNMKEHLAIHDEMDRVFNVDCNNMKPKDHLRMHLELMYMNKEISTEDYNRYKDE